MKNFFHLLFFIFLAVFVNSCQEKVDLIVHNASVYTLGDIEGRVTAFVVDEGKFIDVGGDELINNYDARKVLDLQKLPVYPGFIDSHCHFIKLGLSLQQVDLKGTRSFEEVLNRVQDYSKNKDLRVITGRGWDQNDWKDKSLPNKSKLDSLFPDIPVALRRIDGHALLVNQKALDMAGINEKTKIKGGTIIKNNGRLTGVLVDSPISLVTSILPKPSLSEKIKALKNAEKIAFENGLTTVSVAGIDKDEIYLIDSLQKTGEIQIRVYAMISNNKDNMDHFLSNGPIRTDKLNVRSFKVYADGALGSRGAALKAPYSDLKSHRGEFITPKDSLEKLAYMLSKTPFQMNTHAIGDDANRTILEAYNKALIFSNDPRWRIEHAQVIDTADISLFNRKIIPSVQPTHATSDMYWAEERIGSSRLDGAYAYKKLLDMSGRISLGTDFPVEEVSPLLTFFAAVARQDKNLYPEGGYLSKNKLSRMEALSGMTEWGAYANFEEDQKGSIEVGKVADFIILDRDIILEKESNILKTRIVATLLNGNIVYSNRIN
jgi:predicted amidohydrolase YtcJ